MPPGARWAAARDLPLEAALDKEAARAVLAGEEFVFDVQGHHLEYDLMRRAAGKPFFGSVFPQVSCGADDPRACFSARCSSRISSCAATRAW